MVGSCRCGTMSARECVVSEPGGRGELVMARKVTRILAIGLIAVPILVPIMAMIEVKGFVATMVPILIVALAAGCVFLGAVLLLRSWDE